MAIWDWDISSALFHLASIFTLHRFQIASNQSAAGGVQLLCFWPLIDLLSFISVGPQMTR
jgi:hypothetical protein